MHVVRNADCEILVYSSARPTETAPTQISKKNIGLGRGVVRVCSPLLPVLGQSVAAPAHELAVSTATHPCRLLRRILHDTRFAEGDLSIGIQRQNLDQIYARVPDLHGHGRGPIDSRAQALNSADSMNRRSDLVADNYHLGLVALRRRTDFADRSCPTDTYLLCLGLPKLQARTSSLMDATPGFQELWQRAFHTLRGAIAMESSGDIHAPNESASCNPPEIPKGHPT